MRTEIILITVVALAVVCLGVPSAPKPGYEITCPLIGVGVCSPVKDKCQSDADCVAQGKKCCPADCGNDCRNGIEIPTMDEFLRQVQEYKKNKA